MIDSPLDNPVYAALTGPLAPFAQAKGRARRFLPEMSPFGALPLDARDADWDDLRDLAEAAGVVVGAALPAQPAGWPEPDLWPGVQLVAPAHGTPPSGSPPVGDVVRLGDADIPEMVALVARTEPGPFASRTIDFGGYLGVRVDGALVAMAGQRLRVPGHTEISAVCTAPEQRGHGLGGWLTEAVAAGIRARGEVPFLHALASNSGAVRLYESLGFRVRREIMFRAQPLP